MERTSEEQLTAEGVVRLAYSRPWAEKPWARELLSSFPDRLDRAATRWGLSLEHAHLDGAGLPVLEVRARVGAAVIPAVVKFDGAGTDLEQQRRMLAAAGGRGFVRLLEHDDDAGAVLLERLGATLSREVGDPIGQTDIVAGLLEQTWQLPLEVGLPFAPDEKARGLLTGIETALETLTMPAVPVRHGTGTGGGHVTPFGHELSAARLRTLERARDLARELADSPSATQVVVHGDPHESNVLRRGDEFAFIDPDGFRCEPEYDAGVALRDHQLIIDDLEHNQAAGAGCRWHQGLTRRLAHRLELDPDRVSAWAFVERVTTGLHLSTLGYTDEGESWLVTADRMVG